MKDSKGCSAYILMTSYCGWKYAFLGNNSDQYKVHDLNVEAEAVQEDEDEDENDWEDG